MDSTQRTRTPPPTARSIITNYDLDRLTRSAYHDSRNEPFTYDDLGNRLTLNNRSHNNIAYVHNLANEYTSVAGNSLTHDNDGRCHRQVHLGVALPHKTNLPYSHKTNSAPRGNAGSFVPPPPTRHPDTYASGSPSSTTRFYYDGWRVLTETDESDNIEREFIYGNYLDEVLVMVANISQTATDHYYTHDHLFSPAALLDDEGTVEEYYEYDAYGKCSFYDANFNSRSTSSYNNSRLFTGQMLDTLDNSNLLVMYYKNRFYIVDLARFSQRDKFGLVIGYITFDKNGNVNIIGNNDLYGSSDIASDITPDIRVESNIARINQIFTHNLWRKNSCMDSSHIYDGVNANSSMSSMSHNDCISFDLSATIDTFSGIDAIRLYQDGMNIYQYCEANPVLYIDPYGLEAKKCKWEGSISGHFIGTILGGWSRLKVAADGTDGCNNYSITGSGSQWFAGSMFGLGWFRAAVDFSDYEAICQWPIANGTQAVLAIIGFGGIGLPIDVTYIYGDAGHFQVHDIFNTGGIHAFIAGGVMSADLENVQHAGPSPRQ